jgi:hypothetical protein
VKPRWFQCGRCGMFFEVSGSTGEKLIEVQSTNS